MSDSQGVLDALRSALGASVETDRLEIFSTDKSGHDSGSRPLAVAHANSIEAVQSVMRIASQFGVAVVPRGAGTGLAGGAIASAGEIVLSTLGMNRVLEVSAADELAVVEPGIINSDLNEALAADGLWWAPDPASKAISTVGGNIATNAGGLLCA
ncbi:MAG: FAD-linked oxidase, partial [Microbacteriaceae bacterium]|nr:FAD-linked oxidase [Microbacteriaceae bacterium]